MSQLYMLGKGNMYILDSILSCIGVLAYSIIELAFCRYYIKRIFASLAVNVARVAIVILQESINRVLKGIVMVARKILAVSLSVVLMAPFGFSQVVETPSTGTEGSARIRYCRYCYCYCYCYCRWTIAGVSIATAVAVGVVGLAIVANE